MSGQLKEVRTRITSVISTQQITKAMKMVSAAKLRRAQNRILEMRPYSLKMNEILSNLVFATNGDINLGLAEEREIEKVLIVVVTSDRGLCGGFNSNVIKASLRHIKQNYEAQANNGNVQLFCIGKKGFSILEKSNFKVYDEFLDLFHDVSFDKTIEAVDFVKKGYLNGDYDKVEVIYNCFKNPAVQHVEIEQFLPILSFIDEEDVDKTKPNFIFEPDIETLVTEFVPRILNTQFFRYILESNASEHGARMTAMDKATENAGELLRDLRLTYNRARQAAITTEINEIVSGAASLEGG